MGRASSVRISGRILFLTEDPDAAAARFGERMGETLLGVAIAAVFALAGSRRPRAG